MLAVRQRCSAAAARVSSKSLWYQQEKEVVGRWACVVEPRSSWRFAGGPHTMPTSPFSRRPMLLLDMRGAKWAPSTGQGTKKQEAAKLQQMDPLLSDGENQHPDVKSTSDLFVRWEIPWDGKRVIITVASIGASYLFLTVALGMMVYVFKQGQPLNPNEIPILLFTSLILQTLVGTYVIKACIKSYSPLSKELFSYDWRDPFSVKRGWLLWGVIGTFCSVAAAVLVAILTNREPFSMDYDILRQLQSSIGTSRTSTALLLASVGVLAPFWEETVFRGFLLTSLTKWVPTHVAVLLSGVAFALIHLTPGKFPVQFALGVVFGFSYSKTGNLLTPIVIHGVWNSGVILLLTFLHHQGYDIRKLIESERPSFRKLLPQRPDSEEKK